MFQARTALQYSEYNPVYMEDITYNLEVNIIGHTFIMGISLNLCIIFVFSQIIVILSHFQQSKQFSLSRSQLSATRLSSD